MSDKRYVTPSDRDYMVRTVLGEAAEQGDDGMSAVAHVIWNRVNSGKFGRTPTDVVLAKNQFEPWMTRRDELFGYDPASPAYKKAAAIVDDVIGGKAKDLTSGATHFINPDVVVQRGDRIPDWARGTGLKIGAHRFHRPGDDSWAPEGGATPSILDHYTKPGARTETKATPVGVDIDPMSLVTKQVDTKAIFDKYTKKTIDDPRPVIGNAPPLDLPQGPIVPEPTTNAPGGGFKRDVRRIAEGTTGAPGRFASSLAQNFSGGIDAMRQGSGEIRRGNLLPSGELMKPSTWEPGGVLRAAGGALGATLAPLTAATEMLIEDPAASLTGNKEFGQRAGVVANAMVPAPVAMRSANRLRPAVQAEEAIGGTPLTSEALQRLRDNPRLTPMDVDPSLRQLAMGIYTEPGDAKNKLYSVVRKRADSAPQAVREAYSEMAGPAPNVLEVLDNYKKMAQSNASKGFGEAFKGVKVVNPEPVIKAIDAELKPGVTAIATPGTTVAYGPFERELIKLRAKLTDGQSTVTDPARLHEIQVELGKDIRDYARSTDGASKKMARELKPVHDALVKQIDDATGGKYQPARQQYKSDMEVQEAFERGTELVQNRPGLKGMTEDSPEAWRRWSKDATTEELQAARLGARAAIEQRISGYRHSARRGTDIEDIPFNQVKFEILFGKAEAKRINQLLRDERDIAITNSKIIANSDTAERLAGREATKVRDKEPASALGTYVPPIAAEMAAPFIGAPPGVGAALASGAIAGRHVLNRLGRRSDIARNRRMADLLSEGGEAGMGALKQSMRRAEEGNRLMRPALPVTYVPPEVREQQKRVPLIKE